MRPIGMPGYDGGMLRTVDEYREWYRRRLGAILATLRGVKWGGGAGDAVTWPGVLRGALGILVLLMLAGGLVWGLGRGIALLEQRWAPGPVSRAPEPPSSLERRLTDYLFWEGHARRGVYFAVLVSFFDESIREGRLTLSEEQVRNMLGPPDRVAEEGYPCWVYLYDAAERKGAAVVVSFREGWAVGFGFAAAADLPPDLMPAAAPVALGEG